MVPILLLEMESAKSRKGKQSNVEKRTKRKRSKDTKEKTGRKFVVTHIIQVSCFAIQIVQKESCK